MYVLFFGVSKITARVQRERKKCNLPYDNEKTKTRELFSVGFFALFQNNATLQREKKRDYTKPPSGLSKFVNETKKNCALVFFFKTEHICRTREKKMVFTKTTHF